jgi:5'-3' exonuclease
MKVQHHYVIDTKLLVYNLKHSGSDILNVFNSIGKVLGNFPKGKVILCADLGESRYRKELYPQYKGHRKALRKDAEEHEAFNQKYRKIIELFKKLPVTTLAVPFVEADDLASLYCEKYKNKPDHKIHLITGDMDWYHMVLDTVNIDFTNPKTLETVTRVEIEKAYNVTSRHEFTILKALQGDRSDNLKFIKQFGEVRIRQIWDKILMLLDQSSDNVCEIIEEFIEGKKIMQLHQFHTECGNDTVKKAYECNMAIGDPFTDTDKLSAQELIVFNNCLKHTPEPITLSDFNTYMLDNFHTLIQPSHIATKIFQLQ